MLCDVKLEASGQCFAAHKLMLSCESEYMRTLFQPVWDNKSETVKLPMTGDCASAILDWIYAGHCIAPEALLGPLLEAAEFLVEE